MSDTECKTGHSDCCKELTINSLLFPLSLIALTLLLFLGFQARELCKERDNLKNNIVQQQKPFEESQKLQAQLAALVGGTEKLAESGSKGAKEIAEQLKKIGVTSRPPENAQQTPQPNLAPIPLGEK